ncbi:NAD-dependent epimerase/dehydratase family protein [Micromonospora parastrephiae]|uniref:NAD-dependent epimerase/dehydratase family protein n=1 Tax=Micromonospora parastrephiae TaxID=2806101 RepID=UPI0038993E82
MSDQSAPITVVTGAAGGIGRAVTAALTESGHRVVGVDVEPVATRRRTPRWSPTWPCRSRWSSSSPGSTSGTASPRCW